MGGGNSKELEAENKKLKEDIEQYRLQLSKEMHTNVSAKETSFENVQIQARPMKISEEYANFCTDQWLEAKQEMDESKHCSSSDEVERVNFLCNIILVSREEAQKIYDKTWQQISTILNEPVKSVSLLDTMAKDTNMPSKEVEIAVGDHFRKKGEDVNITGLVQNIGKRIENESKVKKAKEILKLSEVKKYTEQAARICWKMVLQRPPMTFKTPQVGKSWKAHQDKYNLDPQYGSDQSHPDAIIHCYVQPIMYHEENIYGRAKVLVGPKEKKFETDG